MTIGGYCIDDLLPGDMVVTTRSIRLVLSVRKVPGRWSYRRVTWLISGDVSQAGIQVSERHHMMKLNKIFSPPFELVRCTSST